VPHLGGVVVGFGVAAVGYIIGELVTRLL